MSANKKVQTKVVKKKVKPYPIDVILDQNGVKMTLEIIHLSTLGFISKIKPNLIMSVGQDYQASFQLPVLGSVIQGKMKVLKTYDRAIDPKQRIVERFAEMHFVSLRQEDKKHILSFLAAIRQKSIA